MRLEDFLARNAEVKNFDKGQLVFAQGDQAEAAWYVIEGQVDIFQEIRGRPSVLATLEAGQIFGEMALLRFDRYTLSAKAVTPVKLYLITPELLQQQIRETHPLIKAILDMLVERIHNVNDILIKQDMAAGG